ncbi:MAG: glycosyltransferase family 2 protein [Candidatus Sumerlaeia bacterium]|nr:glycosyltransferase family 2 protein [Candidatus Sumerlaeia bacterium]
MALFQPRTLILIPAYNAGPELGRLLSEIAARHPRGQILVIDDGSTTTDYADLRAAGWRVERRPHGGKGAALRAGFEIALRENYDWVVTMDADGQHAPADLPRFADAITADCYDLIVGNRMHDTRTMPLLRKATNRFTSWLLRRLTRVPLHDVQSGYRALRRRVLEAVQLTTTHYDMEIEQLIRAARAGMRIGEVPIATIYNEGKSFISKTRDTCRFIRLIFRLLVHRK